MGKVLLQFSGNWADEMDISGMRIEDADKWEKLVEFCKSNTDEWITWVGTNQMMRYRGGYAEAIDEVGAMEISDDEAEFLKKVFGGSSYYGHSGIVESLFELMHEDEWQRSRSA